ncbi:MAG: AAA family ATPase [Pirellulaceae bacterium]
MSYPSPNVSRLIEANMTRWLEREKLERKIEEEASRPKLGPYVVISRQCGAGGEEIAASLSEHLGWDLADREILDNIASDFQVSKQLVDFVDEKHVAWLTGLFEAWLEGQAFSQPGYIRDLGELLMIAAQHGNFVMVGRGSQFILPRDYGLFVRLHAPVEYRIQRMMESQGLLDDEAHGLVDKTDQERTRFLREYFRNDGTGPELYDLVIDTSRFAPESVVDMVSIALKSRHFPAAACN